MYVNVFLAIYFEMSMYFIIATELDETVPFFKDVYY